MFLESMLVDSSNSITDASVQNQWNTQILVIPANTLKQSGDLVRVEVDGLLAANGNSKEYQLWATNTRADIGGTNANLSASGTNLTGSLSTTNSGVSVFINCRIQKTGASTQKFGCFAAASTTIQGNNTLTATLTDTLPIFIGLGFRNTTGSAASITQAQSVVTLNTRG